MNRRRNRPLIAFIAHLIQVKLFSWTTNRFQNKKIFYLSGLKLPNKDSCSMESLNELE